MLLSRYKVCVYAISKNEGKFVDRWMDSAGEADLVVVVDTGSTDDTVERLLKRGAVVYRETISPWRFDVARNVALDHVPEDADICVSIDLDEVFDPGWRALLEASWRPEHTRAVYPYIWSFREDGTPETQYTREKIHRRKGFRWVRPVHEVLEYDVPGGEKTVWVEGLVLKHYQDLSKPRSQYLPLLELSVAENPLDDRAAFWLGREYMYYGMRDRCIETLKAYLALPTARWAEERSAAMRLIARCHWQNGDRQEAKAELFRAIAEYPTVREPYLAMAMLGYEEGNWPLVYAMVKKGLEITRPSGSYLTEPEAWGAALYDYGAIAAWQLGLLDEAVDLARAACREDGGNERLKRNLAFLEARAAERAGGEGR